jgi:hypothetical protein
MALINMLPEKKEKGENAGADVGKHEGTQPWGTKEAPPVLHLEGAHLGKLGLKKLPAVGSKIHIHAIAHVHSAHDEADDSAQPSGHEGNDASTGETKKYNANRRLTLHMHQMDVRKSMGSDEDQNAESQAGARAEMDKALKRAAGGKGGKKGRDAEGEEGNMSDNAPRGSNGPRG